MIRLAKPQFTKNELDKAIKVINSGNLTQGEMVIDVEEKMRKYLNVKHAILVSSGTAALHLAMFALDLHKGDEVIAPAFTFPATTNVIELIGANTVLVDINETDFCINTDNIEDAITGKTKAIVVVHEFGQPADMSKVTDIAKKHHLKVIEDAACALGAEVDNRKVGTIGDIGCFSLHPRKAITTGEGGVVITDIDRLADKIRALRNHGMVKKGNRIDFVYAGLNYRITDFQAALCTDQISRLDGYIKHRKDIAAFYDRGLGNNGFIITPLLFSQRKHAYQSYHVLINARFDRNSLIKELRTKGIETNYGAYAIHLLGYYKNKYNYKKNAFPHAARAYGHGLVLPIGSYLNLDDAKYITATLNSILK